MPVVRSIVFVLLTASVGLGADLRVLSGKAVQGDLTAISEKQGVVLKTKDGPVATPLVNVLQVELAPLPTGKPPAHTRVELTDGSILKCQAEGVRFLDKKQVELTLLSGVKVTTPLNTIHVVLKDAQDIKVYEHADWKRCLEIKRPDVVAKWNKEKSRINGFKGSFDEGGDGTAIKFLLDSVDRTIDLKDPSIQGLIFAKQANPNFVPSVCKLDDLDQNRLIVAQIDFKEGGGISVITVTGAKVDYPLNKVARLDFSKGKVEFLSDLPKDGVNVDVKVEKEPDEKDRLDHIRFNKNLDDNKIQLRVVRNGTEQVEPFEHGLALPAPAQIVYKLNGEYDEFSTVIGVDETVGGDSRVRVIVEADGNELLSADVSRSAVVIKGKTYDDKNKPQRSERVSLNVKDVKELRIKVQPLGLLPYGNHVNLADAKISKASQ
jgi:hypothetical protein